MNNNFKSVLLLTLGMCLGHFIYEHFLADIPSYTKAVEHTWYQFNALLIYWWFTK
jgi:hypothetical protein